MLESREWLLSACWWSGPDLGRMGLRIQWLMEFSALFLYHPYQSYQRYEQIQPGLPVFTQEMGSRP